MIRRFLRAAAGLALPVPPLSQTIAPPPATPIVPVIDTYHGVTVTDPYRWLENGADPQVKAWSKAQTTRARAYLDHTSQRPKIAAELKQFITGASPSYAGMSAHGDQVFATYDDPKFQQAMIVALNKAADPASRRIVLDPNKMDPSGHTE